MSSESNALGSLSHSQAKVLYQQYKKGEGSSYLDEAIVLMREALDLRPKEHPDRHLSLNNLGLYLYSRYQRYSDRASGLQDIEEAISFGKEALDLCPKGHPDRSTVSNNFAKYLYARYLPLGAMQDLDEAIIFGREAVRLRPKGHPNRSDVLHNLAIYLFPRYNHFRNLQDLDEAIVHSRETVDLRPKGHPKRSAALGNLGSYLSARYDQLKSLQDLEEAMFIGREALDLSPKGHSDRVNSLHNLALSLYTRYRQLGEVRDLDEAVVLGREALELRPKGHPDRSLSLNNLAMYLSDRYHQLGALRDIEEAILHGREVLDLCPKGHPDRSRSLNNLASYLSTRYNQFASVQDLDEAIVLGREALSLRPKGHPLRSASLGNLGAFLATRYIRLRVLQDLDEAIFLGRAALDLCPEGHPKRSGSLTNLGLSLYNRHQELGDLENLEEAITLAREALKLCPKGHPDYPSSMDNLGSHLCARYWQLGTEQDLDEAIVLKREALDLRPRGHPARHISLKHLGDSLLIRFKRLRASQDLDEAIVLCREAFHLSHGSPTHSEVVIQLSNCLSARFSLTPSSVRKLQDKEELFNLYAHLVRLDDSISSVDLSAVEKWIHATEFSRHSSLLFAYETGLRLLVQHLTSLPSLPQNLAIFKERASSLAVDAFSACLRRSAPVRAVELLEQGRGIFWSQLTRLQSPLGDVEVSSPEGKTLAEQFRRVALDINTTLNTPSTGQHEKLCSLNLELQEVVTSIRQLPGLSRFLLSPLFSDLRCAASGGPVIILNASQHSCDALIIFIDKDPAHIQLQITREHIRALSKELITLTLRARRADMTRELAVFLRSIWDRIVSPIVDVLQTTVTTKSRIWWCPTAECSLLPLHAAGPFRKGQRSLADLYISSYTPTLTALIRARQRTASDVIPTRRCFVAIGQAAATGERELPSVSMELDNIGQLVDGLATFTRIEGQESCIPKVVDALEKNEWVHFACHGLPNPAQPFESAFALHDGHFTIQQIIGRQLKNPEFAYLSACHTTVGYEKSPDESIHLASAMQFIGFRSVIGTMWAVDDGETKKITATFYKHMTDESGQLDYTRAAYALNETMKSSVIRTVPFDQRILYIHIGA